MNALCPALVNDGPRPLVVIALWLFLSATIISPSLLAQMAAAESADSQSRFHKTTQYLQGASPQLRSEFAAIALTHLINGYRNEARLARDEARSSGVQANASGWSLAVSHYANQIPLLLNDIGRGFPVRLTRLDDSSLAITVSARTIILSHVRLDQQHVLEHKILSEFCAVHRCEQFLHHYIKPVSTPASRVYVRPEWTFTARATVCSYQGINVHFEKGNKLAKSRAICNQLLREVTMLVNQISWQRALAVPIQWSNIEIEIQDTVHGARHILRLNELGDTAVAALPLLYGSPRLFQQILPWIRQWLANPQEASLLLKADQYGWGKP